MRGTKGPRLRFPPGSFVRMADDLQTYEVVQAFRMTDAPSTWLYRLIRTSIFESRKEHHQVWWPAQSRLPPFNPLSGGFSVRTVRNEDMIRLAEHLVDDVMLG